MPEIPLGGSFYQSESLPISAQECVNMYLNIPRTTTTSRKTLLMPAGITEATTAGGVNDTCRGVATFKEQAYFVQGNDLYRVTESGGSYSAAKVNGATSITGTVRVAIAENGDDGEQMVIVDPSSSSQFNAWIYSTSGGLNAISDTDFDGPVSDVEYVDGYFIFTKKDGQKFFKSALRDGTNYSATDFADAEASPDPIVGSMVLGNRPIIFGSYTMQPFANIGGSGFPFKSDQGAIYRVGLSSQYAKAVISDFGVFLGTEESCTPSIWITDGGRPEKISSGAIDNEISRYSSTEISTCFTWRYSQAGAQFVAFTFPGQETFVLDFTTKEWHTRESVSGGNAVPSRIAGVADAYGVLLVGDTLTNKIGVLDRDVYDEFGVDLPRRFVTPQLDNEGQPFFIDALELVCETGVGNGDITNPSVQMSFSTDGGRTFNTALTRNLGVSGDNDHRVIWNQLGRISREVCFKFVMSDPAKWAVQKVEAIIE